MKKLTAYIFLFAASFSATAQRSAIRSYQNPIFAEWETTPRVHPLSPEYAHLDAYFILNSVNIDYKYEGKSVTTYYTLHRIIKVLDEKGIESFNKVSFPVYHNSKVLSIKARTILPNGKVYEIPRDMIKETINESGIFEIDIAMEGVEKNAEIEILLKEIKQSSYFGEITFQYSFPVQHTYFTMTCPKEMIFEEKGYNGFPDIKDTLIAASNRRKMQVYIPGIPALKNEPYSFYDLYRMRAEYRLSYYVDDGDERERLNTWDDLAKKKHTDAYTFTDKEKAAVNKYISTLGITNKGADMENIRKIEEGIKNNIVLYNEANDENDDLDSIITHRSASESGYIKLFAACFTLANVPHALGITTDKREHLFDNNFENWTAMENYVFYFPTVKKFLAPTSVYYRCPIIPDGMIGNKALLCVIPPNGKLTGQICEVRTITPLAAGESQYAIKANVRFTKEMEPEVDITYSYSGYSARDTRTNIMVQSANKKKEAIENMILIAEKPENIIKYTTANEGFGNYYTNKPLEIAATVKAPQLVEKAGTKYLFKIGDIIGRQSQLYKETERVLPVDLDHPHSFSRTITVNIPKGYKVLNAETIRKQADYVDRNGKPVIAFTSDYKIQGNTLTVTINEFYSQLHYATSEYERYRNVINTAADFNKVALVMAKI